MLEAALELRVANFSRLARAIQPLVQKKRMEKVGLGAIVMALRRLKVPKTKFDGEIIVDSLVVNSDLIEFVFSHSEDFLKKYARFAKAVSEHERQEYISLVNGPMKSALIVSSILARDVARYFAGERQIARLEKLSAITLLFDKETPRQPGIFYPILRALAWEKVSFTEIASSHAELSLFFEDRYLEKAFSTIKSLTSSA